MSFNLLQELFYPRNHIFVKQGRKTMEEVSNEFSDYVKLFQDFLQADSMNPQEFLLFFKFISAHFQQEKDFSDFLENGFRYNELRNLEVFQ